MAYKPSLTKLLFGCQLEKDHLNILEEKITIFTTRSRSYEISNFIGSDQKFAPYHLVAF